MSFADLKRATLEVRDHFENLGFVAYLKLTGGKGLHVVVPLKPSADWEAVKGFSKQFVDVIDWVEEPGDLALRYPMADKEIQNGAQLTVRIVDEAEGTELNERYRHRTGPTNVLSFPFEQPALLQPPLLGDIVLCAPVVAREAAAQGKAPAAHWAHLVVHGVLHLLGHDHEDERQAEEMEALERDILATLGLPDPYAAERAAGDAPARRRDESHKKVRKDR